MKALWLCALLGLAATNAGCIGFSAVSSAPVSKEGVMRIEDDRPTIRVSKGVALAIECRDTWMGSPCENATAQTVDAGVAKVLPAHLDKARDGFMQTYDSASSQRTIFVVAGVDAGETELRITSGDGNKSFHVIVER